MEMRPFLIRNSSVITAAHLDEIAMEGRTSVARRHCQRRNHITKHAWQAQHKKEQPQIERAHVLLSISCALGAS
jgi:hypothetical protein